MKAILANRLLMVVPEYFGFNLETTASNPFQHHPGHKPGEEIKEASISEFNNMVVSLRESGINVYLKENTHGKILPDSIFPNNWVAFLPDGTLVLFPMMAVNRRPERDLDFIKLLAVDAGYEIKSVLDLSYFEEENKFLEGTGSMVLDHDNRIAFAAYSSRTNQEVLNFFCEQTGYEPVFFHAVDRSGLPIYHTNVLMTLADKLVILCKDAIQVDSDMRMVRQKIKTSGKEIMEISLEQLEAFAGNMLQLRNNKGQNLLVMSLTAYQSLTPKQIKMLQISHELLVIPIPVIEKVGGGSVRCMMAEIFTID